MKTPTTMRERVERYIAARKALGYQFAHSAELRRFARFADETGHRGPLSAELALRWARSSHCSMLYQARKLEQVRCLARFLAPLERGTDVPLPGLLGPAHRRIQPHIYTPREIASLLAAAAALAPTDSLRPRTYSTLIGLLASTGLRPGEAVRLDRDDVNAPARLMRIRETKFGKSRLVPMHPSTSRMLVRYATFRDRYLGGPQPRPTHRLSGHLPRTRQGHRHLLVSDRDSGAPRYRGCPLRTLCQGRFRRWVMSAHKRGTHFASVIQRFFCDYLTDQRNVSPRTIAS
jgi:integrase